MVQRIITEKVTSEELKAAARIQDGKTTFIITGSHMDASDARSRLASFEEIRKAFGRFMLLDESPDDQNHHELFNQMRNRSRKQIEMFRGPHDGDFSVELFLGYRKLDSYGIQIHPLDIQYTAARRRAQELNIDMTPVLDLPEIDSLTEAAAAKESMIKRAGFNSIRNAAIAENANRLIAGTDLIAAIHVGSGHAMYLEENLSGTNVVTVISPTDSMIMHMTRDAEDAAFRETIGEGEILVFAKHYMQLYTQNANRLDVTQQIFEAASIGELIRLEEALFPK